MSLSQSTRQRIESLLGQHRVVLFMKGQPEGPRCGFSARAVGLLKPLVPDLLGIDVLADPELREGIKLYGNWPTIPQLYVEGELIGGSDIIASLYNSGELHGILGLPAPSRVAPTIHISARAADAIRAAMADAEGAALHLEIDGQWQARFSLQPAEGHEIRAASSGIEVLMDLATAARAEGLEIDWTETVQGAGLSLRNPNAPVPVRSLSVTELAERRARGDAPAVVDVRPGDGRASFPFPAEYVLEEIGLEALLKLPRTTPLAFLCQRGNSSQSVAEHLRQQGFTEVYNIAGGIDAWSQLVHPSGSTD